MKKVNITLAFDDDKLDALEFSLKKENASAEFSKSVFIWQEQVRSSSIVL